MFYESVMGSGRVHLFNLAGVHITGRKFHIPPFVLIRRHYRVSEERPRLLALIVKSTYTLSETSVRSSLRREAFIVFE